MASVFTAALPCDHANDVGKRGERAAAQTIATMCQQRATVCALTNVARVAREYARAQTVW